MQYESLQDINLHLLRIIRSLLLIKCCDRQRKTDLVACCDKLDMMNVCMCAYVKPIQWKEERKEKEVHDEEREEKCCLRAWGA
jgi:uncharacterized lipoprotein YajG